MLVIVIGAGASFDSLGPRYLPLAELANPGWRPPLTAGLFEPRADTFGNVISQFPDVRPLIIQLADAVDAGEQVEDAIQRIAAASAGSDRGSRQLAALQFYLQEVLWRAGVTWAAGAYGLTNYVQLVDAVERWRSQRRELVAYVTFNYDLMLEEALGPLVDRTSFDGYVAESTWLLKVHGSVDWGRGMQMGSTYVDGDHRAMLIDRAPEHSAVSGPWGFFTSYERSQPREPLSRPELLLYPALALPTRSKSSFVLPQGHFEMLERAVRGMDRLLVIGWRAQDDDFLDVLSRAGQPIDGVVVTSHADSAESVVRTLRERMPALSATPDGTGFSGFVGSADGLTAFLARQ